MQYSAFSPLQKSWPKEREKQFFPENFYNFYPYPWTIKRFIEKETPGKVTTSPGLVLAKDAQNLIPNYSR